MSDEGTIAFAERVLALLDPGSYSATYKYALFTAILDLCMERLSSSGEPPTQLTTRALAEKVVALYWPHAGPYEDGRVLRQGGVRRGQQAEVLRAVQRYREPLAGRRDEGIDSARRTDPVRYERLIREVEWKLIEMPIPRLQVVGPQEDRFLYEYAWPRNVRKATVSAYQGGDASAFDNRLLLKPRVAEQLLLLNGVLRPLVRREWATMVAGMNGMSESRLEAFLFGPSPRASLASVRAPLVELQRRRCFYCRKSFDKSAEVDHFIPWARYPDDGLDNLVVAHPQCNQVKSNLLAAASHVEEWARRALEQDGHLAEIARQLDWERDAGRTSSVARATYSRVPGDLRLWESGRGLVPLERERILRALGAGERAAS